MKGSMDDKSEPLVRFSKPVGRYETQWNQGNVHRNYNTVKYKYLSSLTPYGPLTLRTTSAAKN